MGVLDRLRRRNIPANMSFAITQEGREKLREFGGDPKSRILQALETNGSGNITEISQASALSRGQVERVLPHLISSRAVQPITSSMMEED